jgi:hypothetical protein
MSKRIAPTFCEGISSIDGLLTYGCQADSITYYHGLAPVFSHARCDDASFRMIVSQFYVNGATSQAKLVAVFGINPLALKRWVKQYRAEGTRSFFEPRTRRRSSSSGSSTAVKGGKKKPLS